MVHCGVERGGVYLKKSGRYGDLRRHAKWAAGHEGRRSFFLSLSLSLSPSNFFFSTLSKPFGAAKGREGGGGGLKKKGERYFRCRSREETKTKDKILVEKNPPNKKKRIRK